jgi:hypothetical protein
LDVGGEAVRLHGVIDRVDQRYHGLIRVIDYKTGGSHLSKGDLISGRRLQLPIYALAAQEALGLGTVVEGFYWQIRDAKPVRSSSRSLKRIAQRTARRLHCGIGSYPAQPGRHSFRAVPPIAPKGGCPKYCPAVQWCWRYQAGY